jgi:hypothetical protein
MKKTAFWELLNLIFCKIYDEKRRFMPSEDSKSYRRQFWVGVKEQNSEEGLKEIIEHPSIIRITDTLPAPIYLYRGILGIFID